LAADIRRALGVEAELIEGKGGNFDVAVDGRLVFSKHELGRFPDSSAEVLTAIENLKS
jgi:selT/selW/selH-like putative selenoprotein